jgi:hypothetical protein
VFTLQQAAGLRKRRLEITLEGKAVIRSIIRAGRDAFFPILPRRIAINIAFYLYHRRFPELDYPLTFNERIQHSKLYNRNPLMTRLCDKISAKEYVADSIGMKWIIPDLWSGEKLPPRSERNWPIPYVLKANHGSSWNYFVLSEQDQDWDRIEKTAARWLKRTYGKWANEWLYSGIKPRLLVEPFKGTGEVAPPDYKFFVFGGRTAFIQVDLGRLQTHRQFFYDTNWKRLPFTYVCEFDPGEIEAPQSLEEMIRAAEFLAAPFPFVRVDFYQIDGTPFFGEFTFHPNGGFVAFKPESVEQELGRLWPEESCISRQSVP